MTATHFFIYPAADQAIVETANFSKFLRHQEISRTQVLELKLCALFLPTDSRILVSHTYKQESPSTRLTMAELAEFAEQGFIRLFTSHVSL